MSLKTYEDGSELTVTGLAIALVAGAIGATMITVGKEVISNKLSNRRKHKNIEILEMRVVS